jgi:phosphomannomutase
MSSQPIVSVSGIRGVIGESLTPEIALPYVRAFAAWVKGKKVVLGSDSRPSRSWLVPLVQAALVASGKEVIDLGIVPTPTVGMMVRKFKAAGGIVITASHNPIIYNGLKFFHGGGEFFTQADNARLKELYDRQAWVEADVKKLGKVVQETRALELHIEMVMKSLGKAAQAAPAGKKRAKKLKVVVDCCNGAGSIIAPALLRRLGCEVIALFTDPTQPDFPRGAEPVPAHLGALCRAVKKNKADLGFALDPDADRLAVVDERGIPLGEERTLTLSADAFFAGAKGKGRKGPFVVNLSCSMAMDDVAKRYGVEIRRTPVGEANVVEEMKKRNAPIGGEGNGGVIFPATHPGRDAATAIAWILIALRRHGGPISALNATYTDYAMIRSKVLLGKIPVAKALEAARKVFQDAKSVDDRDGLKFLWPDRWFHVRPSNTEPIIRMTAEAVTEKDAQTLIDRATQIVAGK